MSTFIPNRFCILIANFVTTDVFTTYEPSVELSFRKLTDHEHCLMSIILQCAGYYSKKSAIWGKQKSIFYKKKSKRASPKNAEQ